MVTPDVREDRYHSEPCGGAGARRVTVLTEAVLFGHAGMPMRVREHCLHRPPRPFVTDAVKVMFAVAGSGHVRSGSERVEVLEGSIITLRAERVCEPLPAPFTRTISFYFQTDFARSLLRLFQKPHPLLHQIRGALEEGPSLQVAQIPRSVMRSIAPCLVELASMATLPVDELRTFSLATSVLGTAGRVAGIDQTDTAAALTRGPFRREVAAAIALMHDRLAAPWTVGALAEHVSLSPSQFTRVFKEQAGLSPAVYLRRLRADRMAELLTASFTVAEAAREVGWGDPSLASRAFRNRFGVSPSEYISVARLA